ARIRRSPELPVLLLHGGDATERPVRLDADLVPAAAQVVDHLRAEPSFERKRPPREPTRVEGRDEVIGVELRGVDRLLQVEPAIDVPEEDVEGPLLLLVAARRPPREPRLALTECQAGRERRAR